MHGPGLFLVVLLKLVRVAPYLASLAPTAIRYRRRRTLESRRPRLVQSAQRLDR